MGPPNSMNYPANMDLKEATIGTRAGYTLRSIPLPMMKCNSWSKLETFLGNADRIPVNRNSKAAKTL